MYRLIGLLFPGEAGLDLARDLDTRIAELPGLAGIGADGAVHAAGWGAAGGSEAVGRASVGVKVA